MVQSVGNETKRPSVLPYALGGTAAGALAGWGLSKAGFTQGAKYSSWQDILKDSKDDFKKMVDAAGDNAEKKKGVEAVRGAYTTYKDSVRKLAEHSDAYKNLAEFKPAMDARQAAKDAIDNLVNEAKQGKLGFEVGEKTGDELTKAAKEHVNKLIKNKDDKVKVATDALATLKEKNKALAAKAKEGNVQIFKETIETNKNKAKEAATTAWEAVKDKVKDFKKPRTLLLAGGLAVAGLVAGLLLRPKAKPVEEAQA